MVTHDCQKQDSFHPGRNQDDFIAKGKVEGRNEVKKITRQREREGRREKNREKKSKDVTASATTPAFNALLRRHLSS